MGIFHAAVLGIVQGLSEFLPVSSSAHLIIIPWFAGWEDPGATFDVALHMGTLAALLAFFWRDWVKILTEWNKPMLWFIVIASIPGAVFGYKYEKYFDTVFHAPLIIGVFMMVMGAVMGLAEKFGKKLEDMDSMTWGKSLFIGCAQVLALMPGVSRSGITMTAGVASGFKRESAAKFSFLLATPITAGAGLLKLMHIVHHGLPKSERTAVRGRDTPVGHSRLSRDKVPSTLPSAAHALYLRLVQAGYGRSRIGSLLPQIKLN